jgi:hypothetical protein
MPARARNMTRMTQIEDLRGKAVYVNGGRYMP